MKIEHALYLFLLLAFSLFFVGILAAPLMAIMGYEDISTDIYRAYHPFCHQMVERSLCLTEDLRIVDCTDQGTDPLNRNTPLTLGYSRATRIDGKYKLAVCARDTGIYLGIILGIILFPLINRKVTGEPPSLLLLIIALIPMALDGGTQLMGLRTSTNFLRIITGLIAGGVMGYFLVPLIAGLPENLRRRVTQ